MIGLVVALGAKKDWNPQLILFFEGWHLRRLYDIFFFCPGNESANGTRRRLVGNVLCCIECNRSIGGSICSTVCSHKIRFRGNISYTSSGKEKSEKTELFLSFRIFCRFLCHNYYARSAAFLSLVFPEVS